LSSASLEHSPQSASHNFAMSKARAACSGLSKVPRAVFLLCLISDSQPFPFLLDLTSEQPPSPEQAYKLLQAHVEQLEKENNKMKKENNKMNNDMAYMTDGVMSVFDELLRRKMRERNANFDDFPQEVNNFRVVDEVRYETITASPPPPSPQPPSLPNPSGSPRPPSAAAPSTRSSPQKPVRRCHPKALSPASFISPVTGVPSRMNSVLKNTQLGVEEKFQKSLFKISLFMKVVGLP
jgi:hypothetical protein